jgi:TolB-like protein
VIAHNTAFTFKGKSVDVKQVARELGVRYVVEGNVRKAGQRVRVGVQLIDAETGAHLWADRFDRQISELFELQDAITSRTRSTCSLSKPRAVAASVRQTQMR